MAVEVVLVAGTGESDPDTDALAQAVGAALARAGVTVLCGGLGGVMAAACRGARSAGGTTVALLPGAAREDANQWVDIALPTGLGEARNVLLVRAADAVVAIGGGYGTLSEIAFALKAGRRVIGLQTWDIDGVQPATDAAEAVHLLVANPPVHPLK